MSEKTIDFEIDGIKLGEVDGFQFLLGIREITKETDKYRDYEHNGRIYYEITGGNVMFADYMKSWPKIDTNLTPVFAIETDPIDYSQEVCPACGRIHSEIDCPPAEAWHLKKVRRITGFLSEIVERNGR